MEASDTVDDSELDRGLAEVQALMDLRRFDDATAKLAPLIAAQPQRSELYCLLAQCRMGAHDHQGALDAAGQALRCDPQSDHALRLASIASRNLGDERAAADFAARAVAVAPDSPLTQIVWSHALRHQSCFVEAAAAARRAVELAPSHPGGHTTLGLVALDARKPAMAEEHARRALAIDPSDVGAREVLALSLARQGRRKEAIHYYGEIARERPEDDHARQVAGRLADETQIGWRVVILGAVVVGIPILAVTGTPSWSLLVLWGIAAFGLARTVVTLLTRNPSGGDPKATWRQRRLLIRQRRRELHGPDPTRKALVAGALILVSPVALIVAIVVGDETSGFVGLALVAAFVVAVVLILRSPRSGWGTGNRRR